PSRMRSSFSFPLISIAAPWGCGCWYNVNRLCGNELELNPVSDAEPVRSPDDARFMGLALALGRRGLGRSWPNPAVGSVVGRDDGAGPVVVGRGWTKPGGRPHAETVALTRAAA